MKAGNMVKSPQIKISRNDFEVDFEIVFGRQLTSDSPEYANLREQDIVRGLNEVSDSLSSNASHLHKLDKEIDRLTNSADGIDYIVAVGSGVLAGIIDSFWVGEFNLERGTAWSSDKINNFVVKTAQTQGYKGDDLQGAIRSLENKFHLPSDSNISDFGGGLQHHLRDFAHHPNLVGLLFSLLTQFTEKVYGTDEKGLFKIINLRDKTFIGKDIPQKFIFGSVFWFFHLVSDMAGSSSSLGYGTGLPGPLLALAKELSTLPFFRNLKVGDNSFSLWISKLFNGTLLAKRSPDGKIIDPVRFDLRSELGVVYELGRQAIPVVINECLVRGFYFVRRLAEEIKKKNVRHLNELNRINWDKVKPFRNRTIVRMLAIAAGTFTLIDLSDAAIRGVLKSGGNPANFGKEFLLRVNFVGVGRFSIAVVTDIAMGIKKEKLRDQRMAILSKHIHLMNAKVYYLQADAWIAAETTEKTISEAEKLMEEASIIFLETWKANRESMHNIGNNRHDIEKYNPGLIDDVNYILKGGNKL